MLSRDSKPILRHNAVVWTCQQVLRTVATVNVIVVFQLSVG